jgi:hypothetical protein
MGTVSKKLAAEIIGWLGAAATVSSFLLVSTDVVAGDSILYQLLSLGGAVGVLVIAIYKRVYQLVAVSVLALAIATAVLLKLSIF